MTRPVCSCAGDRGELRCQFVIEPEPEMPGPSDVCGLPICEECAVFDFDRVLCKPHALHAGVL